MGQWNYKNYVLELNFYDNPTDPRIVEFMKGLDFTTTEWDEFIKGKLPLQSKRSQEMISFVVFAFANATDDVPNPAINAIATKIFLIIVIF